MLNLKDDKKNKGEWQKMEQVTNLDVGGVKNVNTI